MWSRIVKAYVPVKIVKRVTKLHTEYIHYVYDLPPITEAELQAKRQARKAYQEEHQAFFRAQKLRRKAARSKRQAAKTKVSKTGSSPVFPPKKIRKADSSRTSSIKVKGSR